MLALVTGATGFVGSHVCRALVARGHAVRAFHRPGSSLIALEGVPFEHAVGDVLDPGSLRAAMRGVDWAFHAAGPARHWRRDAALTETIVPGLRHVLQEAARARVRRIVFTSSIAALGVPEPGRLLDERCQFSGPDERWRYGHAKAEAERELRAAVERGLDAVIVNPAAAFGPADLNRIAGTLILALSTRWVPAVAPGGMNVVHVGDVAAGHLAAVERGRPGERYILGGANLSHVEVARVIADEVGVRAPALTIPPWLVEAAARAVDLLGRVLPVPLFGGAIRLGRHFLYCDTSKASRELGLGPPTPFRRAVGEAVAWYRAHGHLPVPTSTGKRR